MSAISAKEVKALRDRTGAGILACREDRKSTRLNSSHVEISYAVFCLKKKKQQIRRCVAENPFLEICTGYIISPDTSSQFLSCLYIYQYLILIIELIKLYRLLSLRLCI